MDGSYEEHPRQRRMVVADDDPAVLRLLAERCTKLGFQVETAMNGVQLLVNVRHNHPDIVIADVDMPALDGLSVCAQLLDPDHKPLEVVVITGGNDPETAQRCDSLGTFFARKGPDFWKDINAALVEIYPDLAEMLPVLPAPAPAAASPRRPRVLVADNERAFEKFLASRLAKYGVDTLYAPDATQAWRTAVKEKPSVIVAENSMPDGDAHFLLHRLRAEPVTAAIPVVVISAARLSDIEEQDLKREISGRPGACAILHKSFDPAELFEVLRKYCSFKKPDAPPPSYLKTEGW
jgi:CheY-like chemotaxis protein